MSHPLLTRVLAASWHDVWGSGDATHAADDDACGGPSNAANLVAAIPPAIAGRLEAALDACQWRHCHNDEPCEEEAASITHRHLEGHCDPGHEPFRSCHEFQPLVPPATPREEGAK